MFQLNNFIKGLCFLLLCLCSSLALAQEPFRVMFYNVENLFDTYDDKHKNDNEFLPESTRHWTYSRYKKKLSQIAKVIIHSGNEQVPELVGLCEVENDTCIRDLVKYSPLREAEYQYVMTQSSDERGIDVALLYQRHAFKLLEHTSIHVPIRKIKRTPTRDILHVTGKVISGDTLDVFVVHYPSRSGGRKKSETYRMFVSSILKSAVDSLMNFRQHPYVVVMGDFNDYPHNQSVTTLKDVKLCNLMEGMTQGSYRYKTHWGILDQILISENLLFSRGGIRTSRDKAQILQYPFLMVEDDKYGGEKPFRTYYGMKYQGGYSDHLPIAVDLQIFTRDDKGYYLE